MNAFERIELVRKKKGHCILSLIDPDLKNDPYLTEIIKKSNNKLFDGILVGGSTIEDDKFESRVNTIKNNSHLPIMLFPGSVRQLTPLIDSVLYLNLISGRNPKYLIEEHVKGAFKVKEYNICPISTAYILLDGGNQTSVQKISQTEPLNMNDKDLVLSHALAGEHLGNKIIYFDCGSGSEKIIDSDLLKYITENIKTPVMVGGGINSKQDIELLVNSGASYIVVGNILEGNTDFTLFE